MAKRRQRKALTAIALFLALSGFGGPGNGVFGASAAPTPAAAPVASAPQGSHDPNYYAYATRYYLEYLNSREQAENNAKDPYYFFNYYQFYRERYAPGVSSRGPEGPMPAWFATMPFRNARTQAFARFVQPASPSATPTSRWAKPARDVSRTAGK